MAHSTLHFAIGMAPACGRWLLLSFGLGVFADAPGLLKQLGAPETWFGGAWANLFLFYPLLNAMPVHGTLIGPLFIGLCFAAQYALLLAAIRRSGR